MQLMIARNVYGRHPEELTAPQIDRYVPEFFALLSMEIDEENARNSKR
jgi:hypothetical protein